LCRGIPESSPTLNKLKNILNIGEAIHWIIRYNSRPPPPSFKNNIQDMLIDNSGPGPPHFFSEFRTFTNQFKRIIRYPFILFLHSINRKEMFEALPYIIEKRVTMRGAINIKRDNRPVIHIFAESLTEFRIPKLVLVILGASALDKTDSTHARENNLSNNGQMIIGLLMQTNFKVVPDRAIDHIYVRSAQDIINNNALTSPQSRSGRHPIIGNLGA